MQDQGKLLEIKDLNYAYKSDWSFRRIPTLKGLSLELNEGESFGYLGPNGAGKTTSIKCILGLIRPTSGSIQIYGKECRDPEARRAVGYLPEQPYFYDHLTVAEIMEMYASLAGIDHKIRPSRIDEALELVGVADRKRYRMRALSKGLTQRVAMAQAIVHKPKLLILDEPFSGLDPLGRKEFRDLLFHLKGQGTTLFMSSHILSDVEYLCERCSIMAKGEIKGVYRIKDIARLRAAKYELSVLNSQSIKDHIIQLAERSNEQDQHLQLVFSDRSKAQEALKIVLSSDATLESYQFVQGSLEDLFVELVSTSKATKSEG